MTNYYVYYSVDPARLATLGTEVEKLFDEIQQHSGVRGQWMHRRDDPMTCMEVYERVADESTFEAILERESSRLGLVRKIERFVCA